MIPDKKCYRCSRLHTMSSFLDDESRSRASISHRHRSPRADRILCSEARDQIAIAIRDAAALFVSSREISGESTVVRARRDLCSTMFGTNVVRRRVLVGLPDTLDSKVARTVADVTTARTSEPRAPLLARALMC